MIHPFGRSGWVGLRHGFASLGAGYERYGTVNMMYEIRLSAFIGQDQGAISLGICWLRNANDFLHQVTKPSTSHPSLYGFTNDMTA